MDIRGKIDKLKHLPRQMCRSITFDNGQENRHHQRLQQELKTKTYFCNPYSPWEKGSVENAVGLTRRQWPKKTDYALMDNEEVTMPEYMLNTGPEKAILAF